MILVITGRHKVGGGAILDHCKECDPQATPAPAPPPHMNCMRSQENCVWQAFAKEELFLARDVNL